MGAWTQQTVDEFNSGFSCSQAVLVGCAGDYLEREEAQRVSSLFGGGIAHTGGLCGAVTGALMAIGLRYPKTDSTDDRPHGEQIAHAFLERFREINGHLDCRDLVGFDMSDPQQRKQFRESGKRQSCCVPAVESAAKLLEELLDN